MSAAQPPPGIMGENRPVRQAVTALRLWRSHGTRSFVRSLCQQLGILTHTIPSYNRVMKSLTTAFAAVFVLVGAVVGQSVVGPDMALLIAALGRAEGSHRGGSFADQIVRIR